MVTDLVTNKNRNAPGRCLPGRLPGSGADLNLQSPGYEHYDARLPGLRQSPMSAMTLANGKRAARHTNQRLSYPLSSQDVSCTKTCTEPARELGAWHTSQGSRTSRSDAYPGTIAHTAQRRPAASFRGAPNADYSLLCPLVLGSVVEHISGRSGAMI